MRLTEEFEVKKLNFLSEISRLGYLSISGKYSKKRVGHMGGKISALNLQVKVGSLSPFLSMPTGFGTGHFNSDGSLMVEIEDTSDRYEVKSGIKVTWTYGLMPGVDEQHIYVGIAPMVYAKIVEGDKNAIIEKWLIENHPK